MVILDIYEVLSFLTEIGQISKEKYMGKLSYK